MLRFCDSALSPTSSSPSLGEAAETSHGEQQLPAAPALEELRERLKLPTEDKSHQINKRDRIFPLSGLVVCVRECVCVNVCALARGKKYCSPFYLSASFAFAAADAPRLVHQCGPILQLLRSGTIGKSPQKVQTV